MCGTRGKSTAGREVVAAELGFFLIRGEICLNRLLYMGLVKPERLSDNMVCR